ncbi:MAG: alginate lyase family protein [Gemmatimonadetes bacterium]|nr:alginate lyase family protein [Gemmatimonadota bacterium]
MNSGRRLSLDRLKGRSLAEWRFRARQLAAVTLERAGWLDQAELSSAALHAQLGPTARATHPTAAAWVTALRSRGGRGFFAGLDQPEQTATLARQRDPEGVQRILERADAALAGRLHLLGYGPMDVGTPIDWHRDPVAGIAAPRLHWSRVPYLDPAVAGDHKRVWEINRHQWLVSLGQAWVLTRDARHAAAIDAALTSWMDANPPKRGVNWASSLEVGFRAMAWLWALRLAADAPALRTSTVERAVGHLVLAARHLERNLSTYFSPNTHLTGEALALYHLGIELGDLTAAAGWRRVGREVLVEWLPRHVRPDGTYFEQSTWYHRYTLDFYAHFAALAERNGEPMPAVRDAVRRMGHVLAAITRPDGTFPLIGDDDGGRLLFLDGRPGTDARPALALAGALAQDETLLAAAGPALADVAWILGAIPTTGAGHQSPDSVLYRDGGLAVLRDPSSPAESFMVVDAGPHGALNCGHAHADALSFDLTLDGRPVFVDPGTCNYSTDPAIRDRFRATASHNAATFDGRSSSVMAGPFAWASQARTRIDWWEMGSWGSWLRGGHDGFEPGATYRRDLMALGRGEDRYFVVVDSWQAATGGSAAMHLQGGAGTELVATGQVVQVMRGDLVDAVVFVPTGELSVERGELSPAYGVRVEAPRLRAEVYGRGELTIATIIARPGAVHGVRWVEGEAGRCLEVTSAGEVQLIGCGPFQSSHMSLDVDATGWWLQLDLTHNTVGCWMAPGSRGLRQAGVSLQPLTGGR